MDVCGCGRVIVQPERGRRRQKCFVCSPFRDRSKRRLSNIVALPVREPESVDSLTAATRGALADAGVLDTWQGVAAIRLAEWVDAGSSNAALLVKAHREALEFALADAGNKADVIDMIFSG
jgi:hypothetical protein